MFGSEPTPAEPKNWSLTRACAFVWFLTNILAGHGSCSFTSSFCANDLASRRRLKGAPKNWRARGLVGLAWEASKHTRNFIQARLLLGRNDMCRIIHKPWSAKHPLLARNSSRPLFQNTLSSPEIARAHYISKHALLAQNRSRPLFGEKQSYSTIPDPQYTDPSREAYRQG